MKSWTNEKEKQSEDDWVINRLILNNPIKFKDKRERLTSQIKNMAQVHKKNLRYEIGLAEKFGINIDLLTRSILSEENIREEKSTYRAGGSDPGDNSIHASAKRELL